MAEAEVVDQSGTTTPSASATESVQGRELGWEVGWSISAALAFAICAAMLAAYHFLLPPPAAKFGRVDLTGIIAEQQRGFAELVSKGEAERAYDHAARTGKGLSQAVSALARECGCVILVSDAVVAGADDLTPRLREIIHAKD